MNAQQLYNRNKGEAKATDGNKCQIISLKPQKSSVRRKTTAAFDGLVG